MVKMNIEKRADNLSYEKKKIISDLDDKIYNNKKKINNLVNMQDELIALDLSINKCIDLLSEAVKEEKGNTLYDDAQQTNKKNFYKSLDIIEKNGDSLKRKINDLMSEKEKELKRQDNSKKDN